MAEAVLGAAAGATVEKVGDVLVVRLSGVLTLHALGALARRVDTGQVGRPRALAIDFRGAVLAVGPGDMAALPTGDRGPRSVPAVFVAEGAAVDVLRLHAMRQAAAGLRRKVVTDLAQALEWCEAAMSWPP